MLQASAAAAGSACLPGVTGCAPARAAAVATARAPTAMTGVGPRQQLLLDGDWRFHLGHAASVDRDFEYGRGRMFAKAGDLFAPSSRDFDVSGWRAVDLPHDWAVELPFRGDVAELIEFGSKPLGRAYPETSIGWYRRVLDIPASDAGRRLVVRFDGVYRDAVVALNGHYLGRNLGGYVPFELDISDVVEHGAPNVLVVRVDATGREGWFYEGAGIYRHCWLIKTSPLHVARWGTFVTSAVGRGSSRLTIRTTVVNDGDHQASCTVSHSVVDPSGRVVATARSAPLAVAARDRQDLQHDVDVREPALWSIEAPALYRLVTTIEQGATEIDRYQTPFGIRTIHFDATRGFHLNGAHVVLKGTCNHQDHAGVGSALPDRLHAYRIEKLKQMGSNAYRVAHHPPAPELLDACDRLGMLVVDETRTFGATEEAQGQLERMILRDRNHPCIIGWSIANEEWALQGDSRGARIATTLAHLVRRLDPSRPVTAAMDFHWGAGIALALDVQGCNYERPDRPDTNLDTLHQRFPDRPVMGSEVASTYCTRGIYVADDERGYRTGYDVDHPGYGATAEGWWTRFAARPHLAGGFVWTGFDYRGEPSPYKWPCISSHFGIMDTCGFPKDNYYYYRAWWGDRPVLHLFPHWNWPGREGQDIAVWVHSNLERVELLVDGRSLGSQPVTRYRHLSWNVAYAPGTLEARGYRGSELVQRAVRETTGVPVQIALAADRSSLAADGEDVAVITASVVDARGRAVPTASNEIAFRVSGAGALIGVGNGDPSSHEADKGTTRRLFSGLCAAFVQAGRQAGPLRIEATSAGLAAAAVEIECRPTAPRPRA